MIYGVELDAVICGAEHDAMICGAEVIFTATSLDTQALRGYKLRSSTP